MTQARSHEAYSQFFPTGTWTLRSSAKTRRNTCALAMRGASLTSRWTSPRFDLTVAPRSPHGAIHRGPKRRLAFNYPMFDAPWGAFHWIGKGQKRRLGAPQTRRG